MRGRCIIIACFLLLTGCEDVIEVSAPAEPPRLIVDALIRIDASQSFQFARVRVGLTDSFFGQIAPAGLEQITITNVDMSDSFENPNTLVLLQASPGVYERSAKTDFFTSGQLVLQIAYKDQLYLARTRYVPTVPIDRISQGDGTFIQGDETEVIVSFTDNGGRDDYYLFDFDFGQYLVTEDKFYQGQPFTFSYFYDNRLEPGKQVSIGIMGVDERLYTYMDQLIQQSGDLQGPFQTPSATVHGNIINATDIDNIDIFDNVDQPDNFALGYFAVVQQFVRPYTIQ